MSNFTDFFKNLTPSNILGSLFRMKFFLFLVAFLIVVVGGISIYFSMIDWNKNKQIIADRFSEITGKTVEFDGPVSFRLFPSPYLSAADVKVYSKDNNQKILLARADKLIANLSLYPLIKGDFEVKRMSIVQPEIIFEMIDGDRLNWYTALSDDQKYMLETAEVTLDSVTIEQAQVRFKDNARDIDFVLDNLNAEIVADSALGPYRIDGSYSRDGTMEGFAIALGQLSSSFATNIDFVINYPKYQTYVRFDGSVLPNNYAINGSVIVESQQFASFVANVAEIESVDAYYDIPLALSMELNTNQSQTNLNNVVVKYGNSVGAGSVMIPRGYSEVANANDVKKRIEFNFNLTDLDFEPVVHAFDAFVKKYGAQQAHYIPNFSYDMSAQINAVRTNYKNQVMRDLSLSLDLSDNVFVVKELSALLPGESNLQIDGEIFPNREEVAFRSNVLMSTLNLESLLTWLGYNVEPVAQATYKRADLKFSADGSLNVLRVVPFEMMLDKTSFKGEFGYINTNSEHSVFVAMDTDSLNLDNYLKVYEPEAGNEKTVQNILNYYFGHLGFLKDYNIRAMLNIGLLLVDSTPIENIDADLDVQNAVMQLNSLTIGQFSNASFDLTGQVLGFGESPEFRDLTFKIATQDVAALLTRLGVETQNMNLSDMKNVTIEGQASGKINDAVLKTAVSAGNVSYAFDGKVLKSSEGLDLNGAIDIKAPDFVKFVNDMGYKYNPNVFSLGLFSLKSEVKGTAEKFALNNMEANIGANNFAGQIEFDKTTGRNQLMVNLQNNKFEVDRFFYNPSVVGAAKEAVTFRTQGGERGDFLSKPFLSKTKIEYDFFKSFDLKGRINSRQISYKNLVFKNLETDIDLTNAVLKANNFRTQYRDGSLRGNVELSFEEKPMARGNLVFGNQKMTDSNWAGKKYGFKDGIYNSTITFDTSAASEEEMVSQLNAVMVFDVNAPVFKGWNLQAIESDLRERKQSDGVSALIKDNLSGGETVFDKLSGKITVTKSDYVFENVVFENVEETVKVANEGSLNNWTMNAQMTLLFKNLSNIPPVKFSMTGAIISPVVNVDTADLVKLYDSYWEQLAEERKKLKQAEYDRYSKLMAEQQQIAHNNKAKIEEVIVNFTAKRDKSEDNEVVTFYNDSIAELNAISEEIEDVFRANMADEYNEALIKELAAKNQDIQMKIDRASSDISNLYSRDVKTRVNDYYNKIVDLYNKAQAEITQYRAAVVAFGKRLSKAESTYKQEEDDHANGLDEDIEREFLNLDAINGRIKKNYIFIQNTTDLEKLERYAEDIKALEIKGIKNLQDMSASIKAYIDYVEGRVNDEENAYEEKLRQAEIQKKLEENTGTISVAGKEKVIKVVRDIEDIEKAEEDMKKEAVRILDFSGKSTGSGKIVGKNKTIDLDQTGRVTSAKDTKKSSSFIRKIDDDTVETGGAVRKRSGSL